MAVNNIVSFPNTSLSVYILGLFICLDVITIKVNLCLLGKSQIFHCKGDSFWAHNDSLSGPLIVFTCKLNQTLVREYESRQLNKFNQKFVFLLNKNCFKLCYSPAENWGRKGNKNFVEESTGGIAGM